MIYGQIKNNEIKNVIILEDVNLESVFLVGFDFLLRIDNLDPIPCKRWSYDPDNGTFAPPVLDEP